MHFICPKFIKKVISNGKCGGGSGDCFVEVFQEAMHKKSYTSFLKEDTKMPLIFIDDLIEGTLQMLEADIHLLKDVVYNI